MRNEYCSFLKLGRYQSKTLHTLIHTTQNRKRLTFVLQLVMKFGWRHWSGATEKMTLGYPGFPSCHSTRTLFGLLWYQAVNAFFIYWVLHLSVKCYNQIWNFSCHGLKKSDLSLVHGEYSCCNDLKCSETAMKNCDTKRIWKHFCLGSCCFLRERLTWKPDVLTYQAAICISLY